MGAILYKNEILPLINFKARGRKFTERQLQQIKDITDRYFDEGRTSISRRVCKALRWYQPNGQLKDVACREVLCSLDTSGLIRLPSRKTGGVVWRKEPIVTQFEGDTSEIKYVDFNTMTIRIARTDDEVRLWKQLVSTYHYLGSSRIVGRQLKYLVYHFERPIACFGWGDAAWALSNRDQWIGWNAKQRRRNLRYIVNNVRFLILPWVHVPNLASFLLGQFRTILPEDWKDRYGYRPVLIETFVDISNFRGTCYIAANWIELGLTAGYAKVGASHHNSQKPKAIFVYPLCSEFRPKLKRR